MPASTVRPPRQARSRDTQARISAALRELLAEKPAAEIGVQELATRAGVSVGGFYARFASKDHALAHLLYDGYVAEAEAEAVRTLDPAQRAGAPVQDIVRAYFRLMVQAGRTHLPVLRELVSRTRENPQEMAGDTAWERFRQAVHEPFLRLLAARAGELRHPDPDLAIRVGFSACSSALRETLLFGHMQPSMGDVSDDTLVDELTRMFCLYLGAPDPGATATLP